MSTAKVDEAKVATPASSQLQFIFAAVYKRSCSGLSEVVSCAQVDEKDVIHQGHWFVKTSPSTRCLVLCESPVMRRHANKGRELRRALRMRASEMSDVCCKMCVSGAACTHA